MFRDKKVLFVDPTERAFYKQFAAGVPYVSRGFDTDMLQVILERDGWTTTKVYSSADALGMPVEDIGIVIVTSEIIEEEDKDWMTLRKRVEDAEIPTMLITSDPGKYGHLAAFCLEERAALAMLATSVIVTLSSLEEDFPEDFEEPF